ncbi:MAG: hypothetical protein MI924_07545 [Chloroflexales bacterium]|nr:hypothetical protein [Chloroflexales bacterium]
MKIPTQMLYLCTLLFCAVHLTNLAAAQTQPTSPNQPGQIRFFGMNTYFTGLERIGRDGEDGIARLVAMGRSAGVAYAREELSWGNLERTGKGQWEWSYFDQRLLQMAQSGYGIVGMLLTTPAWARVSDCAARTQRYASAGVVSNDYWCPPANPKDFADYVYATVERYDGDGNRDAPGSPRVAAWQIWNEPNHWETWPGSPNEYALILQAGHAAAKAADPTAIVATGGLYVFDGAWVDGVGHSDGLRFLDAALSATPAAWNSFDVLAIHPHMPDVAPDQPGLMANVTFWGRITTARTWLEERTRRFGGVLRPIWISEVGWSTCSPTEGDCYVGLAAQTAEVTDTQPQPFNWRVAVGPSGSPQSSEPAASVADADLQGFIGKDEQQQANYMVRSHVLAHALGVQHFSYFQLEDKFDGSVNNFWEEASILQSKAAAYQPKAAYYAYAAMVGQLEGTRFAGWGALNTFAYVHQVVPTPAVRYHLRFRTADDILVDVLWRNSGVEEVALSLEPGRSAALVTRDGLSSSLNSATGVARFTVSETPVYIRQTKAAGLAVTPLLVSVLAEPTDLPVIRTVKISNSGSGVISWNINGAADWLEIPVKSGQGWSSEAPLVIRPTGLAVGSYSTLLTVNSSIGAQQVQIRLNVVEKVWRQWLPLTMLSSQ